MQNNNSSPIEGKEPKYYYRPKGFPNGKWCPTTKEFHEQFYMQYDFKLDMTNTTPSMETKERGKQESEVKLSIPPTVLNVGLDVCFNSELNDFVIDQSNDCIALDLSQALQLSDFILNLNKNQHITTTLQAENEHLANLYDSYKRGSEKLQAEIEELKAERKKLSFYLTKIIDQEKRCHGDGKKVRQAELFQLIQSLSNTLTPQNHER